MSSTLAALLYEIFQWHLQPLSSHLSHLIIHSMQHKPDSIWKYNIIAQSH